MSGSRWEEIAEGLRKNKKAPVNILRASDVRIASHIPYGVLTRIPMLDLALGRPGYPVGRIVELYGLPKCGKTSASLMAISQVQNMGGDAVFIDAEFAFDENRAQELGVNIDTLGIVDGINSIEDIFQSMSLILESLVDYNNPFIIVVDSLTGLPTQWELQYNQKESYDFAKERPGKESQAIKRGLRILTPMIARKKVLVIFITHGIETMATYGKSVKSSGGHGLKFHSGVRAKFKHIGELIVNDVRLGQRIQVEAEKTKIAHLKYPKFEIELLNEGGFNTELNLLDALCKIGVIDRKKGSTNYTWGESVFTKADWPQVLNENGGIDKVYKLFIKEACAREYMRPYNSKDIS